MPTGIFAKIFSGAMCHTMSGNRRYCTYCGRVLQRCSLHEEGWTTVHKKCWAESYYGTEQWYHPDGRPVSDRQWVANARGYRAPEPEPVAVDLRMHAFFIRLGLTPPSGAGR